MDVVAAVVAGLIGVLVGAAVVWWATRGRVHSEVAARTANVTSELASASERTAERDRTIASLTGELAHARVDLEGSRAAHQEAALQVSDTRARLEEEQKRTGSLGREIEATKASHAALQGDLTDVREERTRLTSELESERRITKQQVELLEQAKEKLGDAFKSLSAEALRKNNESFLDLAKTKLESYQKEAKSDLEARQKAVEELVKPLKDSLQKVDTKLLEVEKERHGAYTLLTDQVKSLAITHERLQQETGTLVRALRAPAVRGRWGEIQLKRVVEMAGMVDHCDFYEQQSTDSDDGRLRADMLVKLPGGKNLIVDAKAPLKAYLEALDCTDDASREAKLLEHAKLVRDHISRLGSRNYWSQFQPSPEFVVMFLPGEAFFTAALQVDPVLIEYGVDERVIPASPTTLIALLRAVAYGWQQERIAENAQAIADLGRELYDRIRAWTGHLAKVGRGLDQAVSGYNDAVGSLESRVLVSGRRFRELGAATSDDVPEIPIVDRAIRTLQGPDAEGAPDPEPFGTAP